MKHMYTTKHIVVDVYHFGKELTPNWFKGKIRNLRMSDDCANSVATIDSSEGISTVRMGDYVIRDHQGYLFVFTPSQFEYLFKETQ